MLSMLNIPLAHLTPPYQPLADFLSCREMLVTEMLITIKKLRQQTQKEPDYVFGSSELI